jgi:predicted HNH restriction endonuclease
VSKKSTNTPKSRIRQALRQLWLHSRERAAALKREKNTCQNCNRKASVAKGKEFKVEVHHKEGVLNWDEIFAVIYKFLLCPETELEVLCKECHASLHEEEDLLK